MNSNPTKHQTVSSNSGMSLLNVIMLLVLIGTLVTAGISVIGPIISRGKINDTKTTINGSVDAIISWSVTNGRIPDSTNIATILTNPNDVWGKGLAYLYDANLTATASGGLCGRTATNSSYNGVPVAFILLSGGDDFAVNSVPGATGALPAGALGGLSPQDLFRVVSLDELKAKAGCSGNTQGRLRIVNNELPKACSGKPYSANIFADGGVLPYSSYNATGLPTGLARAGSLISGTPTTTGISSVTIQATDSQPNTVQKTLPLNVISCGCPSYRIWNTTGNQFDFQLGGICLKNINNNNEITSAPTLLADGQTLLRKEQQGNCNKALLGSVTYAQAVAADLDGDCMVNYVDGTPDSLTDR
jgi:type II secretory pathway pseudopilin PulG